MSDTITLTGVVATDPRPTNTKDALPITSFRLASNQRRFDRGTQAWVDGDTNWYTVTAFRQLALNSNTSIRKGDRIIVTGRLRIRDWDNGTRKGTAVEVDAVTLGHDLTWGTASFTKNSAPSAAGPRQDEQDPGDDETEGGDDKTLSPAAYRAGAGAGARPGPGDTEGESGADSGAGHGASKAETAMALAHPPF